MSDGPKMKFQCEIVGTSKFSAVATCGDMYAETGWCKSRVEAEAAIANLIADRHELEWVQKETT